VELKGIDDKVVEKIAEEGYFTRDKPTQKHGEEQFFKQGEKPEVSIIYLFQQRAIRTIDRS